MAPVNDEDASAAQQPPAGVSLFGYGRWTPAWLQKLSSPKSLLCALCFCCIVQGMLVNGIVPVSISTLEKRFGFSSTKSGIFVTMYEIGVILVLIPVCHFGGKGHKGHWLGGGMLFLGLGALTCSLPQFVIGPYHTDLTAAVNESRHDECRINIAQKITNNSCDLILEHSDVSNYFYVFLLGQLFHGFGAAPLYTLGITYLDENVSQKSSPLFVGIYLAFSVVGPAVGFMFGGWTLGIFGDIDKSSNGLETSNRNPDLWYGAWWLGYVTCGCLAFVCGIPLLGFPRRLPGATEHRKKDVNQAYFVSSGASVVVTEREEKLSDLPQSCLLLTKNVTYVFLVLVQVCEGFLLNGFTNFVPKLMQNLFSLSSSNASLLTGAVVVPGGFFGNLLGGFIIKRFRLRCSGMILVAVCAQSVAICLSFVFLAGCPQPEFAGVTVPYDSTESILSQHSKISLESRCNANCACSPLSYNPVCHKAKKLVYYSPCYAGCAGFSRVNPVAYDNCDCVGLFSSNDTRMTLEEYEVELGVCSIPCNQMGIFLAFFGLLVLATFTSTIPLQQAVLRCTNFNQRNLALGITSMCVRIFGSIPGAILFGLALDQACSLWHTFCGVSHSCLRYNSRTMRLYVLAFGLCLKSGMLFCLVLAWRCYRGPSSAAVGVSHASNTVAVVAFTNKNKITASGDCSEKNVD